MLRTIRFLAVLLSSTWVLLGAPAEDAEAMFRQNCTMCHGAAAMGGVSLEELLDAKEFGRDFRKWNKVAAVLEEGAMPPPQMPQPTDAAREAAAAWIRAEVNGVARRFAGDPGQVTVRRLTSAEYAYTIEDLTGLKLDLGREFAGDAVGGEGFTNYGAVQFMADANLERYLEKAKFVADHAVIGAGPLAFYQDPGMSGFELSAIHRIHDIYREHGFRAVAAEGGRAFGLDKYGEAFYLAWRFAHRERLDETAASLDELAEAEGLSPRFLRHIWTVVRQPEPKYPLSEVVTRWNALPEPGSASMEDVRAACAEIQGFVIHWPRELFAAGELAAGGAGDERALVITDASLVASTKHSFRAQLLDRGEGAKELVLHLLSVNPGAPDRPVVLWKNAMVQAVTRDRGRGEETPLVDMVDAATKARVGFGRRPDGTALAAGDFATVGETELSIPVNLPRGARGLRIKVDVEAEFAADSETVLRCTISNGGRSTRGTPVWGLLADPEGEGFKAWKRNVLDYAANLPQASHGEPTPADRDPIPDPFDNTYGLAERNRWHQRVKYYRQDGFLVENMLDDATRRELDVAWSDVASSFAYHDATMHVLARKYAFDSEGLRVAALTDADVAEMPVEVRPWISRLREERAQVESEQMAAQAGHVDDAIAFAARAWRRPLSAEEKDRLRGFYTAAREDDDLDHRKAIRMLLTRVLISPAFLYRSEEPAGPSGLTRLSDSDLASRLSYFLWSSPPDAELRRAALAGELSDRAKLAAQARRMLADPKARRFATEFFGQWLGFYRFDQYSGVDKGKFPEFTESVKAAMYDEAVSFFTHIVRERRPVREVFSADYTFMNDELAKHYGVADQVAAGAETARVSDADALGRGGALRLGAVLTATSAPLRTSPVKRGDWVLRRILGTPTPPPPPDAGSIPADEAMFGGQTVKQQLEAHRRNPSCVSCHTRIDPLGFPLEHYDAVGRWRTTYSEGQPIEDASELKGGANIAGIDGLLAYVQDQETQVLKNLSTKLLGYALGRTILASDQPLIDELAGRGGEAAFADFAIEIATSQQFRYRRGRDDAPPENVDYTGAGE